MSTAEKQAIDNSTPGGKATSEKVDGFSKKDIQNRFLIREGENEADSVNLTRSCQRQPSD